MSVPSVCLRFFFFFFTFSRFNSLYFANVALLLTNDIAVVKQNHCLYFNSDSDLLP